MLYKVIDIRMHWCIYIYTHIYIYIYICIWYLCHMADNWYVFIHIIEWKDDAEIGIDMHVM